MKPTNAAAVADLKATLQAQEGTEYFDFVNYELFTFRRWQSWFNSAWSIVNSQNVAEGETRPQCAILISSMPSIWWSCSTPA